jgi:hypothetical protein
MSLRTTKETVTFTRPFTLASIDGEHPAGTYVVETEEELIEGLSFPAYRRISTVMLLPGPVGSSVLVQVATIDPTDLEAARRRDAEKA